MASEYYYMIYDEEKRSWIRTLTGKLAVFSNERKAKYWYDKLLAKGLKCLSIFEFYPPEDINPDFKNNLI